ncbi:hypothetical protein [Clostridium luticellarii]|jgi:hypothetical protein|uniref:hypothetical protein n=1 Tax=Clostridium luticellarii TaxID=1691940 RepID=UPI0023522B7C|nr:hypothetical protein [Clostridium luticellarii]MCI1946476.1 hypothetical protein [Clostridium luticellarii]MCI1969703.1 hypothetical protein [Clostridium luticellarii]
MFPNRKIAEIEKMFSEKGKISAQDLKDILSETYPQGLCCHYYPEFLELCVLCCLIQPRKK